MLGTILVGTDLLPQSRIALKMAHELARAHGARLVVLHVIGPPEALEHGGEWLSRGELDRYHALAAGLAASAIEAVEDEVAQQTGRIDDEVTCLVRVGRPAEVIAEVADELGAELIVVGRGRSGIVGTNTGHLAEAAGRTVLIAPVIDRRGPRGRRDPLLAEVPPEARDGRTVSH